MKRNRLKMFQSVRSIDLFIMVILALSFNQNIYAKDVQETQKTENFCHGIDDASTLCLWHMNEVKEDGLMLNFESRNLPFVYTPDDDSKNERNGHDAILGNFSTIFSWDNTNRPTHKLSGSWDGSGYMWFKGMADGHVDALSLPKTNPQSSYSRKAKLCLTRTENMTEK